MKPAPPPPPATPPSGGKTLGTPFTAPAQSTMPATNPTAPTSARAGNGTGAWGATVISARAWRLMAMAGLLLSAGLALALTIVALQSRTFVHVVEVSPEGQVLNVRAASGEWRASEAQTAYHLGRFVRLVYALPTDGVVLRENWLKYRFLTPPAAARG
ncbi:MAG: hypothetical protein IPL62_20660 [Caulobacteraceae bacterium]|nr:hypothetical protein [Caulobacteraceae bacterium]